MATLKDVMDKAALRCSLNKPSGWIANTSKSYVELVDFMYEIADELLDRLDLPEPISKNLEIVGTGAGKYALPADFRRTTREEGAVYEKTAVRRALVPVNTNAEWTHIQAVGTSAGARYYRITGDEGAGYFIEFYHALETGTKINVSYVSDNFLREGANETAMWADENAILLLPATIIRLGIIWKFRQKKGLPYADINAEYETRISRDYNDKRGLRKIDISGCSNQPTTFPNSDFLVR